MGTYRLRRKTFTQYDDTDTLKRMKDSDILAEKLKKPTTTGTSVATGALAGALAGGAIGGVGKAVLSNKRLVPVGPSGKGLKASFARFRANASNFGAKAVRGGRNGLIAGAIIGGGAMLYKRGKEKKENQFYNRRLEYAQRQAMRREKADWKANMTQRDGYSY